MFIGVRRRRIVYARRGRTMSAVPISPEHGLDGTSRPRRILFVTAEPHPTFRSDVRVLFGKYLPREGILSDLFAQATPGQASAPWPAGRTDLAPSTTSKWRKQWVLLRHDLRLFRMARQGYDAVQVRDRVLAGALGLWAARRATVPFFYWASYPKPDFRSHAARHIGAWRRPMRWIANRLRGALGGVVLYRLVLPRADHVFVQSAAMRSAFAGRGIAPERMTVVPMGVDLDAVRLVQPPSPEWRARLQGRRVIAYLGALDRVRQPGLMIEAMARLRANVPEALLLLIGDAAAASDIESLHEQIGRLALRDHVAITGWVDPETAMGLVAQAEVGLSMIPRGALYDVSSPTKLAEYFALGLPVVANDLPDQAAVLAESGAGECTPYRPDAMADAVQRLLVDPARARAQGATGRQYIEATRSYAALSASLGGVYRRLMAR